MKLLFSSQRLVTILFLIVLFITACNSGMNVKAKKWNPYKNWQVLIFESNHRQRDSIFISEIEELQKGNKQLLRVNSELIDNKGATKKKGNKTDSWLLEITESENDLTVIDIHLQTKTAKFNPFSSKRTSWLDSLPVNTMDVYGTTYKDVLILTPDSTASDYQQALLQDEFVEKIYWSKSQGLIRYDLKNGTIWSLGKTYNL